MSNRRTFITLIGGAAAWPLVARAQQSERVRRIGVLMSFAADDPAGQSRVLAFAQALAQLGWTDGRNVRIDLRWGAGDPERTRRYAAELVALVPDVILAHGSLTIGPLLQATRAVPIVRHRLPAVYPDDMFATEGGLIAYGPDRVDQFRQAAGYIDRILKGEKPADLPVQAPTKYELVINLKTAKALGLAVPDRLLAVADEIIE